jgi:uncharacterized protein
MVNFDAPLTEYFSKQPDVVAAYRFGSTARGTASQTSDLDLAVLLDPTLPKKQYSRRREQLLCGAEKAIPQEVDLILFNEASSFLKYHILRTGQLFYERVGRVGRRFEAGALIEFFDYEPLYTQMRRKLMDAVGRGEV